MSVTKRVSGDYNITSLGTSDNVTITTNTLTVDGNLVIIGNSTIIETNTTVVYDNMVVLNGNIAINASPYPGNSGVLVNRGTSPNVDIVWNETVQAWQITNDGSTYANIGTAGGSGTINSGTANRIAFYATTGSTLSNTSADLSWDNTTSTLTLSTASITASAPSSGGTGLFFTNGSTTDEIASKAAAIKYSIIFG